MELRMKWTMQVCTIVGGNTAAEKLGCVDDLIKHRAAAKETIDLKFRAVFSQRSAARLKCLSRPTPCSMRARAL
jgi:hypothetical protein